MPVRKYAGNIITLADVAKRRDPSGRAATIIEVLSETNDIIMDAPAVMCNDGTKHMTTIRDSIPFMTHRMLNQGASEVKSSVRQIVENTCLTEGWCPVDAKMLELYSDISERRAHLYGEATAILEGMSQTFVKDIFYGNMGVDPAGIDGLSMRFNSLTEPISRQILDAGGTGANLTSVWLIQWGELATSIIYPKGTNAGIDMKTFTDQVLRDNAGMPFEGVLAKFAWNYGLAVRDPRRIVRIANIDTTQLEEMIDNGIPNAAGFKLQRLLDHAITLLPSVDGTRNRTFFYMNRWPHSMLSIMGSEKGNVQLQFSNPTGSPLLYPSIHGIPIRRVDGIIVGEEQVV